MKPLLLSIFRVAFFSLFLLGICFCSSVQNQKGDTATLSSAPAPVNGTSSGPLSPIYFSYDSARISEESALALKQVALFMKNHPETSFRVEGHCDERGTDDYNLALSQKRAKAARKILIAAGVPAAKVTIKGMGERMPAAVGSDESAWAKNRRAEFVLESPPTPVNLKIGEQEVPGHATGFRVTSGE